LQPKELTQNFPFKKQFAWLAVANSFDLWLTVYAVERYGAVELNPLMSALLSNNHTSFIVVKLCVLNLCLFWCLRQWIRNRKEVLNRTIWNLLCVAYALIIIWNSTMIGIASYLKLDQV